MTQRGKQCSESLVFRTRPGSIFVHSQKLSNNNNKSSGRRARTSFGIGGVAEDLGVKGSIL